MKNITYKIVQWSTSEELHTECLEWASQLQFIKDEQRFLDKLIKEYTLSLIIEEAYNNSLKLVGKLNTEEKELSKLLKRVKDHINTIEILQDNTTDKLKGAAFKEIHYYLKVDVFMYANKYRETKKALFKKIKKLMKSEKRSHLLN
ncbi:hypothetical protein [Patiriisocius hiemis]|uniref:Uncharacterized protein n=1 Tax=Patiriisocius hiemis TaxID=3075604 RepID=A0ABU2YDS0_9FLAO|nr:hypothetical protein [Constantimarinum sp. W242]MDT0556152.1 hypothetical protein [Constantimarinum sp. W242]